jgi:hypothetical protein
MRRSEMAKNVKDEKLAQRVGRLEREVRAMTKEGPARPEDVVARRAMAGERPDFIRTTRGNANFETPVRDHLARLQGRSTGAVVSDRERGSASPLGRRKR